MEPEWTKREIDALKYHPCLFLSKKDADIYAQAFRLKQGDVLTINLTSAMGNIDEVFNSGLFKIKCIKYKRFVPYKWYKKLMFWTWIKRQVWFEIEYMEG